MNEEELKAEIEKLTAENESLKQENVNFKADIDSLNIAKENAENKVIELTNIIKNANEEFNTKLANVKAEYVESLQERDKLISELMQGTVTEQPSFIDKINARRNFHSYD